MNHKDTPIPIDETAIKDAVSPHSVSSFCAEEGGDYASEYRLPRRYFTGFLSLMPVNSSRLYAYWEITDDLLKGEGFETFAFKLFDAAATPKQEIVGFYFRDRVGSEYIEGDFSSKKVLATICGVDISGRFKEIMSSEIVCMPSDRLSKDERGSEIWADSKTDWMELVQRSVSHFSHARSSHSYEEEMGLLKNYQNSGEGE